MLYIQPVLCHISRIIDHFCMFIIFSAFIDLKFNPKVQITVRAIKHGIRLIIVAVYYIIAVFVIALPAIRIIMIILISFGIEDILITYKLAAAATVGIMLISAVLTQIPAYRIGTKKWRINKNSLIEYLYDLEH